LIPEILFCLYAKGIGIAFSPAGHRGIWVMQREGIRGKGILQERRRRNNAEASRISRDNESLLDSDRRHLGYRACGNAFSCRARQNIPN
jgi:hypothetical protein